MKDEVREALTRLKPPAHDADPQSVQAWRWFVAITTGATALGLAAHIALACGLLAGVTGYAGFASASDVQDMKEDVVRKHVRTLSQQMLDAKHKQCTASGEAKRLYLMTYNELRAEYFELTRREFPDPPCEDFS